MISSANGVKTNCGMEPANHGQASHACRRRALHAGVVKKFAV